MGRKKPNLDSLVKGGKYCVKCGNKIPGGEIGHRCEIIPCPGNKKKIDE